MFVAASCWEPWRTGALRGMRMMAADDRTLVLKGSIYYNSGTRRPLSLNSRHFGDQKYGAVLQPTGSEG